MGFDVKETTIEDQQPTVWRRNVSVHCGMELKEEMQMDVVGFEMKLSR